MRNLRPRFDAEAVVNAVVQAARGQGHEVPKDVIAMPVTGGAAKELQELCFVFWWGMSHGVRPFRWGLSKLAPTSLERLVVSKNNSLPINGVELLCEEKGDCQKF